MIKKFILLFFFLIVYTTHQQTYCMEQENIKHIVFDWSFLFQPDPKLAAKKLGLGGIVKSVLSGSFSKEKSIKELFGIVNLVEVNTEIQNNETVMWEEQKVPPAMISWLKNKVSCEEILTLVKKKIDEKYSRFTSSRMYTIVDMAFEPTACPDVLSVCQETFKLIALLQQKGHKVHVLGNWHTDILEAIKKKFENDFLIINGKIIVSGDLGHVKCLDHNKIYKEFLSQLSQDPDSEICFVETLEVYCEQIQSLSKQSSESLTTILADPLNIKNVKKQLRKKGILH